MKSIFSGILVNQVNPEQPIRQLPKRAFVQTELRILEQGIRRKDQQPPSPTTSVHPPIRTNACHIDHSTKPVYKIRCQLLLPYHQEQILAIYIYLEASETKAIAAPSPTVRSAPFFHISRAVSFVLEHRFRADPALSHSRLAPNGSTHLKSRREMGDLTGNLFVQIQCPARPHQS